MDPSSIKASIQKELSQASPLQSLKLQNHLYGCFIVMEDLAQHDMHLQEDHLVSSDARFSLSSQFHQLGVHYGFMQDSCLELNFISSEYRDQWISIFRDVYSSSSLDRVDAIEDAVLAFLHELIPPSYDFFTQVSSSGSLSQEWVMKALALLHPSLFPPSVATVAPIVAAPSTAQTTAQTTVPVTNTVETVPNKEEEQIPPSALTKANPENKMHPGTHHHYAKKKVRFDHTRRNGQNGQNGQKEAPRKGFSKTRRQLTGL
jgi:hypothetical protein